MKSKIAAPLFFLIVLLFAWWWVPSYMNIPKYILPSLSDIIEAISQNENIVLANFWRTAIESGLGLLIGSVVAIFVGVLMAQYELFSRISLPYLIASNAIPVIAIAPILILWFGSGMTSKVVVSAFLCFFPLCMNTYKGLNEYPDSYKNLFTVYGSNKWGFFWKYKLYNARTYLWTGGKLNASFCVIGSIVAEIISSNKGLGFGILQATYSLNVPILWGYIVISCLLGLSFYALVMTLERVFTINN